MAFVQPSFLHAVFNTPLALRRNGRLYRKSIHANRPSLTRIPLVKEGETYPFGFSTLPALILRKIKKKVGLTYKETSAVELLHHLSEFVNDIVRSQEVRSYAPYCYRELLNKIDLFYKGDTRLAGELDWWLSFELWRRSLQKR